MLINVRVHVDGDGKLAVGSAEIGQSKVVAIGRTVGDDRGIEHVATRSICSSPGVCSNVSTRCVTDDHALMEVRSRKPPDEIDTSLNVAVAENLGTLVGE